ncbi:MAG: YbhB/YbcL family Raf kinase inhibitor-like protein [Flavobacteriaceae bacterium]|nr:YbhB/YbcL family Raf kinase inhibitor-like protein [Flavobacteriaceae bacterium]|tara:strand:+ start:4278 stop:4793 length:516 start_codon:yes stop_codon:yes gene_type:complete
MATNNLKSLETFTLSSNDLGGQFDNSQQFDGFGCDGNNISPQLSWANAPEGTKSFAITMYDPDAPTGSGWWHWLVFNIPANINELATGAGNTASGLAPSVCVQSINDYGMKGYGGPCPPAGHGLHQYIITVHALSVEKLDLDDNTNAAVVGFNIWANTLGKASIISYFKKE